MTTMNIKDVQRRSRQDLEASVVILTSIYAIFLLAVIGLNVGAI